MPKKKGELSIEERLEQSIVAKEEEPYKLPNNWVWTRLEDISYNYQIGLIKSVLEQGNNKEYKYLKMNNITNNGKLILDQLVYVDATLEEYKKFKLNKGDFLFNTRNSYELVGKNTIFNLDGDYLYNNNILKLNFYENINPNIISYYLNSPKGKEKLTEIKSGTTNVSAIYAKDLKKLSIPLPPLEEQKRIVEKLDSLFEKIQKIKEIIEEVKEKTTSRREAILSKAFSGELTEKWRGENKNFIPVDEILLRVENEKQELIKNKIIKKSSKIEPITENDILFDIPQSWKRIKLNDIAFVTKLAGFEYTKNIFPNLVEKGIPLFKGKNVQDGKIVYEFESYIPESISDELPRSQITKKCLLTPYVGTIGNIALFEGNFKAHLGSNVGKIEVFNNFNENILEKYLLYYFRSCYGLAQLKKHRKATAQESISIEAIRDCVIILPPLEEQKEIVRVLDKIFEEENRISELISLENKIEILEKTILDRAFRGELGTGNSDDEPAIELLKKCLEER